MSVSFGNLREVQVSLVYKDIEEPPLVVKTPKKRRRQTITPQTRYLNGLGEATEKLRKTLKDSQEVIAKPKADAFYSLLNIADVYEEAVNRIRELQKIESELITKIVLSSDVKNQVPRSIIDSMDRTHRHWVKKGNDIRVIGREIPEKGYASLHEFYNRDWETLIKRH